MNNTFDTTVESLFKGMDSFITTKTVVGDAVTIGDTIILPLVDVSFGVGAGAFAGDKKQNAGGGMGAKISPSAILVISNGVTKLVNVKNQDTVTKILDMVPDFVNKFASGGTKNESPMADAIQDAVDVIGILTTFFMPVNGWFVRALAAFSLMIVGYNLFSSGGKCGR